MSINTYAFLESGVPTNDVFAWIVSKLLFLEIVNSSFDEPRTEFWIKPLNGKTIWGNIETIPASSIYAPRFSQLENPPTLVSLDSSAGRCEIDLVLMYLIPWMLIQHPQGLGAVDPQLGSDLIICESDWQRIAVRAFGGIRYDFASVISRCRDAIKRDC